MRPTFNIVDYMMPEMDGVEFIRRICAHRDHRDDLPIPDGRQPRARRALRRWTVARSDFHQTDRRAEFEARLRNMFKLREGLFNSEHRAETPAAEVRRRPPISSTAKARNHYLVSRAAEVPRSRASAPTSSGMSHYSALIASRVRPGRASERSLLMAAPMHDVGKLGIPDTILPARPPDGGRVLQMKRHLQIGLRRGLVQHPAPGATIALTHHEKFDGSGLPAGLPASRSDGGRIVAVADRPTRSPARLHKPAWPDVARDRALREGAAATSTPPGRALPRLGTRLAVQPRATRTSRLSPSAPWPAEAWARLAPPVPAGSASGPCARISLTL